VSAVVVSPISPKHLLVLIALGVIIVALAADKANTWWEKKQAVAEAVAPLEANAEATAGINGVGAQADSDRAAADARAAAAGNTFNADLAKGEQNAPTTRERASRPVPASVRDAYRRQRLEIERSRCPGGECGEATP
jgi:hypothetical protein